MGKADPAEEIEEVYGGPYVVIEAKVEIFRNEDIYECLRILKRAGNTAKLYRVKDGTELAFNKWVNTSAKIG
jgi:ATP-dependent RNA circularization protein (DNA/RNA ligase family)